MMGRPPTSSSCSHAPMARWAGPASSRGASGARCWRICDPLVSELGVPVAAAPSWGHVEHVPERPHHVHVPGIARALGVQELTPPEVVDLVVAYDEHVGHRPWVAVDVLTEVVGLVRILFRRQYAQPRPVAAGGKAREPVDRRLCHDGHRNALAEVL